MEFFPEVMVTDEECALIGRGLLAVARADGQLHDKEIVLVQGFLGELEASTPASLAAAAREDDIAPDVLAAGLARESIGMLFIKSCVLLAHADGRYHPDEKKKIREYAAALEIGSDAVDELEQSVREYLIGQLSGLQNRDAAVAVAKELAE